MSQEWSTFGKLKVLLQETDLLPVQFSNLCAAHGIEISNATISRALKNEKFNNHETDQMLRPLVLGLEKLVEKAKPLRLSFANTQYTKLILEISGHVRVNVEPAEQ